MWRINFSRCWSEKMRQWEGWVGCEVWGTLTFVRGKKKTCSPVKSDAVKCEIAAKSCQMLLQVVIGSGEEEEVKKKKTIFQRSARLFSCNSSAVRMLLCSRTPYQVPFSSLALLCSGLKVPVKLSPRQRVHRSIKCATRWTGALMESS